MTIEHAFLVGLEPTAEVLALIDDAHSAAARAEKADPGDRADVVRFETLTTQLEQIARGAGGRKQPVDADAISGVFLCGPDPDKWWGDIPSALNDAAKALSEDGLVPVVVVEPLHVGPSSVDPEAIEAEGPAERWDSDGAFGRKAVELRFRAQIEEAVSAAERRGASRPVSPSGVQNSVVTEILREFVDDTPGGSRVDVPVEYRDGSRAEHPLPLRALSLRSELTAADLELHFALLSIRHTEMDVVVHGAWLRNVEVSRPRPAAQTDDFVYGTSRRQFGELTAGGRRSVLVHLYQTGLETAVVGFYRALVDHLLESPGSVAVQPMYFNAPKSTKPSKGKSRGGAGSRHKKRSPVVTDRALFRRGTAWQM